jgi:hypothetical protein
VKTALAKPHGKAPYEGFAPIPFVFPEDRASMQINFFLLLQAFNEQRIDQRTFRLMLSTLKAMAKNLGKTGSLVESGDQAVSGEAVSKEAVSRRETSGQSTQASPTRDGAEPFLEACGFGPDSAPLNSESCFMVNGPARQKAEFEAALNSVKHY